MVPWETTSTATLGSCACKMLSTTSACMPTPMIVGVFFVCCGFAEDGFTL